MSRSSWSQVGSLVRVFYFNIWRFSHIFPWSYTLSRPQFTLISQILPFHERTNIRGWWWFSYVGYDFVSHSIMQFWLKVWNYFFIPVILIYQLRRITTKKYNTTFSRLCNIYATPKDGILACPTMPLPSYQKMDYFMNDNRMSLKHFIQLGLHAPFLLFSFVSNITTNFLDSSYINEGKLISSDWYTSTPLYLSFFP